mmetsp:Transcript_36753/g.96658  ORF Transcript_36753/g.96658 Transcript_36753/m.96658 type:complete len:116 (-) Transcript_36753:269-616(-)
MLRSALRRGSLAATAAKLPVQRLAQPQALTVRGMAGCAGGGGYGSGPYRGLKVPKVAAWHQQVATFYGCVMWLWLFWRAKNDGRVFLGLEHPWDHGGHDHGHDDHGHGDGHGHGH